MEIKSLRYFVTVAKYLSFTKAAKECHVTQTAMSLHISRLEEELQFELFSRSTRNVLLTEAGKVFYTEAKKILADYQRAVGKAYNASLGYEGRLVVGSSNYFDAVYLADYLKLFHRRYPKIQIQSVMAEDIHTTEGFYAHKLDLGLCLPFELQADSDIRLIHCVRRPLRVIAPIDHPLAGRAHISAGELAGETIYIMGLGHLKQTASHVGQAWRMSGVDPAQLVEAGSFDNVRFLVSSGLGLGLLPFEPRSIPDQHSRHFTVLEVGGSMPSADLSFAYSERNQNSALRLLVEIIEQGGGAGPGPEGDPNG